MKTTVVKIDFKKDFKKLFSPATDEPEIIEVPDFPYIMIDGAGDPRRAKPEKLRTILRQPIRLLQKS